MKMGNNTTIKKALSISLILILTLLFFSCGSKKEKSPEEINTELVKTENEILTLIDKKDKERALELVGTLNHPSKDEWKDKEKTAKLFGQDIFNGYYSYNEWWNERRESLQKQILEMDSKNSSRKNKISKNSDQKETTLTDNPKEISSSNSGSLLSNDLLGLYVLQYDNGNTQFFKFSKIPGKNKLNIIYQDNIGGNVRIENYNLKSYNEGSGEVILESNKNSNSITKVIFKRDPESSNGYKLVDSDRNSYPYVSK